MEDIIKASQEWLIPFVKRFPVAFVKAQDHYLWDTDGKQYIDFSSGIAVTNLGHNNSRVIRAMKKQLGEIAHISNLFHIPGQAQLAEAISKKSFKGKSFFTNSGAEANETALKIARFLGNRKAEGKNKVLALEGSFHGRTIATVSMTGQEKYRKGFEPLLPNVEFVDFNSVESLRAKFDKNVCAIFLESVQGEGGIRPLTPEFVAEVKKLAKKFDSLVIFDEVQSGIGRTGKNFGYQLYNIKPDMITMAKALGNGMPIGGVHIKPELATEIPAGFHMSTFGGNYLACAAGLAVMKQLTSNLLKKVNMLGASIEEQANALKQAKPDKIGDIRIRGLMVGIDLNGIEVGTVIDQLLAKGFVILRAGHNTIRLVPPFTIGEREIGALFDELKKII